MNRDSRILAEWVREVASELAPVRVTEAAERLLRKPRRQAKDRSPGRMHPKNKDARKEFRRMVRTRCVERAAGRCECGCGVYVGTEALHLDHFWGRAREESIESCWMLAPRCDRDKTENKPTRRAWLAFFAAHCLRNGYREQMLKVDRALILDQAQHPEHRREP